MTRTVLYVVSGLMIVYWLVAPTVGFAQNERNLSRVKKLYEKYCLACHGPQGRSDGATQF